MPAGRPLESSRLPLGKGGKAAAAQVVVVGAGVIGLSIAIELLHSGRSVLVLDRLGPAAGASAGNAGALAFTDILPLASPGVLRSAARWLLDPLGPLTIRPAYALKLAPWFFRFWRSSFPAQVRRSVIAQASLMKLSRRELEPFLRRSCTDGRLRKEGALQVYEGEAEFRRSLGGWAARQAHGVDFRHVQADEMADIQPGLATRFTHGTFTPGWCSVDDPQAYTLALARHFESRGGVIERVEVRALRPAGDEVDLFCGDGVTRRAPQVVLAAGAHSHQLALHLGDRIPLEAERGYNTTLPADALDLRTQITFGGHGFVVTRLASGIRVGGAVEFAGLRQPPNFRRAEAMLGKAKLFLPGLRTAGGRQWMGLRPSLPDSLPAIGAARRSRNVIYAFGHGHLGLTQSFGTARLAADLVLGRAPQIDLGPFNPQRF